MTNQNNCELCNHKKHHHGGHCYMFRLAPTQPCAHHTVSALAGRASIQKTVIRMMKKGTP